MLPWQNNTSDGYLYTTLCSDRYCCENCKDRVVDFINFDGACRWDGYHAVKYECMNGDNLKYKIWNNRYCIGMPVKTYRTGYCYQDAEFEDGSRFYDCSMARVPLGSDTIKYETDSGLSSLNVIGAIVGLLLFMICIVAGYLLYKRRNIRLQGRMNKDIDCTKLASPGAQT